MTTTKRIFSTILLSLILSVAAVSAERSQLNPALKSYAAGNYERALRDVTKVLKKAPQDAPALFLKAQIQSANNQVDAAISTYKQLIKINPGLMEAYNNLATLYTQKGELKEASTILERAIQTKPVYATIHANLRTIYLELSKKHYREALKLKPGEKQAQLTQFLPQKPIEDTAVDTSLALNEKVQKPPASTQENAQKVLIPIKPNTDEKTNPKPTQVAVAKTESVEKTPPPPKQKPVNKGAREVKKEIVAWANAWSNRDANKYVAAYKRNYSIKGKTHQQWVQNRRANFNSKRFIKVSLSNIRIQPDGKRYKARFRQKYQADHLKLSTNKEMVFINENGRWKIASERKL